MQRLGPGGGPLWSSQNDKLVHFLLRSLSFGSHFFLTTLMLVCANLSSRGHPSFVGKSVFPDALQFPTAVLRADALSHNT